MVGDLLNPHHMGAGNFASFASALFIGLPKSAVNTEDSSRPVFAVSPFLDVQQPTALVVHSADFE